MIRTKMLMQHDGSGASQYLPPGYQHAANQPPAPPLVRLSDQDIERIAAAVVRRLKEAT